MALRDVHKKLDVVGNSVCDLTMNVYRIFAKLPYIDGLDSAANEVHSD